MSGEQSIKGMAGAWKFFADRGGTFTDIVALAPDKTVHIHKLLSVSNQYEDPVQAGIQQLLSRLQSQHPGAAMESLDEIRVGTTIGTNALLEHKTARVGLLITSGFRDLLRIGFQSRPDIFALNIVLPEPLYVCSIEVKERVDCSGRILEPLDTESIAAATRELMDAKVDCVAILFLHSTRNPSHEMQAMKFVQEQTGLPVYASHLSSPLSGAVSRGDTTLVDAALGPLIQSYASRVESISSAPAYFMGSAGALFPAREFSGKDSLLSGPAGGVNAVAAMCREYSIDRAVGFDMGGTSTDVFCYDGHLQRQDSCEVGGYRIQAPHLRIHTIASGGGSILQRDGLRLLVGPESAGAQPGPALYGLDGPATITDANVILGRVRAERLPAIFGPGRNAPADSDLSRAALESLQDSEASESKLEELAQGYISIACEQMAGAVRKITIEQGRDPAHFTLVSFGGAGGQVACEVARRAGIKRILFPALAGLFSAAGIGRTNHSSLVTIPSGLELEKGLEQSKSQCNALLESDVESIRLEFRVLPEGSDFYVSLIYESWPVYSRIQTDFNNRFQELYGYRPAAGILSSVLVEKIKGGSVDLRLAADLNVSRDAPPAEDIQVYDQKWIAARHFRRDFLQAGSFLKGPAIISSDTDTVYIAPDWEGVVTDSGDLDIQRNKNGAMEGASEERSLEISAEIHQRKLESIAIEMGTVLQRTARSVNIKERLDFSCAIFDAEGRILVSAPHIPVHLGSMQDSIQAVLPLLESGGQRYPDNPAQEPINSHNSKGKSLRKRTEEANRLRRESENEERIENEDLNQNDTRAFNGGKEFYLINDPYGGGTHLPDVTVVWPVYLTGAASSDETDERKLPDYFVAARGHHADIGGISPGSMPARSSTIYDEGILIPATGFDREALSPGGAVEELFRKGGARAPETNRADIAAQVAACIRGLEMLESMQGTGARQKESYLRKAARASVQDSLRQLLVHGKCRARLELDPLESAEEASRGPSNSVDPSVESRQAHIELSLEMRGSRFLFDFSGSSLAPVANFQTPAPVVRSAVLYCLYLISRRSIPLNAGALEDIDIELGNTFLQAVHPMPVVAGNVETSQVLVDIILMAAGALSPGPGTMNNLSFGNAGYQYYETIGGGSGAGPGFAGTSAVQCHMTNSRITDPEVLEGRFPVILEQFRIRTGSGGAGRLSGGDGIIRQIRFLEDMTVSVLSNRRRSSAPGLEGGQPGSPGRNLVISHNQIRELDYCDTLDLKSGDSIRIETPGGSGYGSAR